MRYVFVKLILLVATSAAYAQNTQQLEEVIITADPLGALDKHLSQPVQVLTQDDLRKRSNRNIGDAVANEPGVSSSDFGPGVGRPIIRGLAGSRVSVLENGISTLDVASISVDHGVPTETVLARQVEIFRGPASLLFGSGASGGVVNVVNDRLLRTVPDNLEAELSIQYETVSDGFTGAGSLNIGSDRFALHLDGMKRDTNDYDIPGFAELEPDEPEQGHLENSSVESENAAAGLSYIGERGFLGFAVSRFTNNYGIPGHHEEETGPTPAEEAGVRIDMAQTRYDFEASLDAPLQGIVKIKTRWAYNDYEHDEVEPNGDIGTQFENNEVEGRIELIHRPIGSWDGVFGLQYRDKDFSAIGEEGFVPPSELDSIGVFLLEKGDFDRWHFELGFRYEQQNTKTDQAMKSKHEMFSFAGAVNWDYTEGYQIGLAVTHAERAPAIEELYANGPHLATSTFEIGNTGLDEETSTNIDLYWHKMAGRFTFSANLFYNQIDDFIFQQEQDLNNDGIPDRVEEDFDGDPGNILSPDQDEELLLVRQAQDDAHFFGFELEAGMRAIDDHRGTVDVRLWADYVEGERRNGNKLPRISPWRFGAGTSYSREQWSISLDYIRVNKQDNLAPLETETSAHDLLNLYVGYTLPFREAELHLFASASNLFNEEIRRHTSFVKNQAPLPGRSGLVGLRASF